MKFSNFPPALWSHPTKPLPTPRPPEDPGRIGNSSKTSDDSERSTSSGLQRVKDLVDNEDIIEHLSDMEALPNINSEDD